MRWMFAVILFWTLLITGCSSSKNSFDRVEGIDYHSYKTYAWLPAQISDSTGNNIYNNDITMGNLKNSVDKEMSRRGFIEDLKNPDILIKMTTNFDRIVGVVQSPMYNSYSYYYWYPAVPGGGYYNNTYYWGYYTRPYISGYDYRPIDVTESSIVIDVVDRKKDRLVWRGWSNEELITQKDVKRLYKDVHKIFKDFPVEEIDK